MPRRIQRRRTKGWKKPPGVIDCGRQKDSCGPYGNPYRVGPDGTATECVATFRRLYDNPLSRARIRKALDGKGLLRWCKVGDPCQADVLVLWANEDTRGKEGI